MAKTCLNCGYALNPDPDQECVICRAAFPGEFPVQTIPNRVAPPLDNPRASAAPYCPPPAQPGPEASEINRPTDREAAGPAHPEPLAGREGLSGRISHLERHDERPAVDIYNRLSRFLIGLLFFIPYGILFVSSGIISLCFAVIGFQGLSQLFNPIAWTTALFELMEVLVLRRLREGDTVPIYRGLIEDRQGQEYSFSIQGPLRTGNLILGHQVALEGQWRRGTFMVRNGRDVTAGAEITADRQNHWRYIFFLTLGLELSAGFCVFFYRHDIISWVRHWLKA